MATDSSNKVIVWVTSLSVLAVIAIPIGVVGLLVLAVAGAAQACGSTPTEPSASSSRLDLEQTKNAATIIGVAKSAFTDGATQIQAQVVGLATALQESGLRNLDHGDRDSLGLFQQRPSAGWGTAEQIRTPAYAAGKFYQHLSQVAGWEKLPVTSAAQAVQVSGYPTAYAKWESKAHAVVTQLAPTQAPIAIPADVGWAGAVTSAQGAGSTAGCAPTGDATQLATELVTAIDAGKLQGSSPDHLKEIRWIAEDKHVAGCDVDPRILQILVTAVRTFDRVGVSDINRHCTDQVEGAGADSLHYKNGGGHAVDFYAINGHPLTGADQPSLELIRAIDPIVAPGTGLGQRQCRLQAGTQIAFSHLIDFPDSCNHVHVDVGRGNLH